MISQEEKLQRFEKAVSDEIDNKIKKINASAEASRDEIIEKANDESLIEAYDKIKDEIKNISQKYTKLVSKAELDSKREVLLHREKILKQILDNVIAKLYEFTKSDKYINYIKKSLNDEIPKDTDLNDIVVYVSKDDISLEKEIKNAIGDTVSVESRDSIKIGGICVFFKSENIIKDRTLDSALEEQRVIFNQSDSLRLS